jgi:hypothetical protein
VSLNPSRGSSANLPFHQASTAAGARG